MDAYGGDRELVEAATTMRRRTASSAPPAMPEDVIVEILRRLPIKSLIRFRCVCKLWYNLPLSPNFAAMIYDATMNHSNSQSTIPLYCCSWYNPSSTTTIKFHFSGATLDLNLPFPLQKVRLVGCANGVVCLSLSCAQDEFLLWNPVTHRFRHIPPLSYEQSSNDNNWVDPCCGFSFDPIHNTFKVTRLAFDCCFPSEGEHAKVQINVFTSSDSTWREKKELVVPDYPSSVCHRCRYRGEVTCIKNCMYWLVSSRRELFPCHCWLDKKHVLCFDLVDESFKKIPRPPHRRDTSAFVKLSGYKGSLAMFVRTHPGFSFCFHDAFDVWVLNDDQSWSRQLIVRPSVKFPSPVGFYSKDEVDLVILTSEDDDCTYKYNPRTGETKKLLADEDYLSGAESFQYSGSLASVT